MQWSGIDSELIPLTTTNISRVRLWHHDIAARQLVANTSTVICSFRLRSLPTSCPKAANARLKPRLDSELDSRLRQSVQMLPGFSDQQDSLIFSIGE